MNRIVVGVDIAKRVFQLHWVEPATGAIVAVQLRRAKFLEHFANRHSCLIGMEACGGSQHWARALQRLGHEVKLLPGKSVKPFVGGNKSDAADARAIWTAVQQPGINAVAVKTEEQQAVLALHRMREQLVKFRTAQTNGLQWQREGATAERIAAIPGVGLLTATAAVATMGDAKVFKSGREFAAWLGLVQRHTGTGGRMRLLGISKRGDRYLRTLLIHCARALFRHSKNRSAWFSELAKRRPINVAIVAMANKIARTIWALIAHDRSYQAGYMGRAA